MLIFPFALARSQLEAHLATSQSQLSLLGIYEAPAKSTADELSFSAIRLAKKVIQHVAAKKSNNGVDEAVGISLAFLVSRGDVGIFDAVLISSSPAAGTTTPGQRLSAHPSPTSTWPRTVRGRLGKLYTHAILHITICHADIAR